MAPGRSLLVTATVIAALALGGVALWYRAQLQGTPAAVAAPASPNPFAVAGSGSVRPPAKSTPAPVDGTATAVEPAGSSAEGNFAAADADQRQLAKITRGMSASAGGGIVVTATPPGSVTGQLRLREGDVIIAVNGVAISSPEEFARIYREQGLPRQLTILRDGREIHRH